MSSVLTNNTNDILSLTTKSMKTTISALDQVGLGMQGKITSFITGLGFVDEHLFADMDWGEEIPD